MSRPVFFVVATIVTATTLAAPFMAIEPASAGPICATGAIATGTTCNTTPAPPAPTTTAWQVGAANIYYEGHLYSPVFSKDGISVFNTGERKYVQTDDSGKLPDAPQCNVKSSGATNYTSYIEPASSTKAVLYTIPKPANGVYLNCDTTTTTVNLIQTSPKSPFIISQDGSTLTNWNNEALNMTQVKGADKTINAWIEGGEAGAASCGSAYIEDTKQKLYLFFPMHTQDATADMDKDTVSETYNSYMSKLFPGGDTSSCRMDSKRLNSDYHAAGFWSHWFSRNDLSGSDSHIAGWGYCTGAGWTLSHDKSFGSLNTTGHFDDHVQLKSPQDADACSLKEQKCDGQCVDVFAARINGGDSTDIADRAQKGPIDYNFVASRDNKPIDTICDLNSQSDGRDNVVLCDYPDFGSHANTEVFTLYNGDDGYQLEQQIPTIPTTAEFNKKGVKAPANLMGTTNTLGTGQVDNSTVDAKATCQGGALGWMICPLIDVVQQATDTAAKFLSQVLTLKPLQTGDPIYGFWGNIRNVANVMFVIAFMVIIFSQATSVGISNYGIKRMLPRIVAAAILVNVSFFICQVAVDISNIIGSGIMALFGQTANTIGVDASAQVAAISKPGNPFLTGAVQGVAAIGLVLLVLAFAVPVMILILVTFAVLAARTAAVILLTVIAPVAFVAWILPNTEKWFKRWVDLFVEMLALYPILMIVFAACTAASKILSTTDSTVQAFIGLIIQALPLFAIPAIVKASSGMLGRVQSLTQRGVGKAGGDKLAGLQKDALKRAGRGVEARMASSNNRFVAGVGGFRARMRSGAAYRDSEHQRAQELNVAQAAVNSGDPRRAAAAQQVIDKRRHEETAAQASILQRGGLNQNQAALRAIAAGGTHTDPATGRSFGGNPAAAAAAMNAMAANGDVEGLRTLQGTQGVDTQALNEAINSNAGKIKDKAPDLVGKGFANASAEDVTGWHPSTLKQAFNSSSGAEVGVAFEQAMTNPTLRDKMTQAQYKEYIDHTSANKIQPAQHVVDHAKSMGW